MSITLEEIKNYIEIAKKIGCCNSAKKELSTLTTLDDFLLHPHAPRWAYWVSCNIIKGRWEDAEEIILRDGEDASSYAIDVLNRRWPEAEPQIIEKSSRIIEYASILVGGRWYEAEPVILTCPNLSYNYALHVIQGRWEEAETIISSVSWYALQYSKYIINGRWQDEEKEEAILKDASAIVNYTMNVIGGRWLRGEITLLNLFTTIPYMELYLYARDVIKGRWPEAEQYLIKDEYWYSLYESII